MSFAKASEPPTYPSTRLTHAQARDHGAAPVSAAFASLFER